MECSNPQCQNPFCQLCPHCRSRECTRRTGCTRKPVPLHAKQQLKNIDELSTFECDLCLFPRCSGSRCKIEMTKKQKEDYRKKEYWSTMSMKKRVDMQIVSLRLTSQIVCLYDHVIKDHSSLAQVSVRHMAWASCNSCNNTCQSFREVFVGPLQIQKNSAQKAPEAPKHHFRNLRLNPALSVPMLTQVEHVANEFGMVVKPRSSGLRK